MYRCFGPEGFGVYEIEWDQSPPRYLRVSRPPDALLVPGFVDIHIHGAFGIDFMSATESDMRVLAERLEGEGYEAFFPTTVTASASEVLAAVANLPEHEMIPGFHLEGPFISPAYPGAQPPSAIVDPPVGPSEWDAVLEHPRLRLVTLAPERPHALQMISRLRQRSVLVSMGHTEATFDQARHGYEFGASHTTHTFNAMRPLHHREAGTVGYALTQDGLTAELIYDRLHVCKEAASILIKSKPERRVIAVSDSSMVTRTPPNRAVEMWGHRCVVGRGDVRLKENGALAGSAITLLDAFRNLADDFGEETAIRLCALNPRRAMGMFDPPRVLLEFDKKYQLVGRRVLASA